MEGKSMTGKNRGRGKDEVRDFYGGIQQDSSMRWVFVHSNFHPVKYKNRGLITLWISVK
jgi:hypothetical protein